MISMFYFLADISGNIWSTTSPVTSPVTSPGRRKIKLQKLLVGWKICECLADDFTGNWYGFDVRKECAMNGSMCLKPMFTTQQQCRSIMFATTAEVCLCSVHKRSFTTLRDVKNDHVRYKRNNVLIMMSTNRLSLPINTGGRSGSQKQ